MTRQVLWVLCEIMAVIASTGIGLHDRTTWCFCPSWWSTCQIRQSGCHKFLPCLVWDTGNPTGLTPIVHHSGSRNCQSWLQKKRQETCCRSCQSGWENTKMSDILDVRALWSVPDTISLIFDCHTTKPICRSRHSYSDQTLDNRVEPGLNDPGVGVSEH